MAMAPAGFAQARFWIGLAAAVVGFVPAAWSARLFLTVGEGTPAPGEPVDKIPPAFERRCIQAGSLRSALLLGRIAVLFSSRRALPARRLAALGARADLSTGSWAPPSKLVVLGPYRYVRNPMIRGVIRMVAAEALLLGSWPIAGWMLVFFLLNTIYLIRVEEPALEQRFGEDYRLYKSNVRRWIPRVTPWDLP